MKRTSLVLLFSTALSLAPSTPALAAEPATDLKERVAMLPLQPIAPLREKDAAKLRLELSRELMDAGTRVQPLSETDRLLAATDLSCKTRDCLIKAAGLLGAAQLLGGRISKEMMDSDPVWTLDLWLFDQKKAATLAVTTDKCPACSAEQMLPWAKDLLNKVMDEARAADRRTQLMVATEPPGASVNIDSSPMGVTNMAFGVSPGRHTVAVQLAGYKLAIQEVTVTPGTTERIDLKLERSDAGLGGDGGTGVFSPKVMKWVTAGAAVAGLTTGIVLLATDGKPTCDTSSALKQCRELTNHTVPGSIFTAAGALSAVGSAVLFYVDAKRNQARTDASVTPLVLNGGTGVRVELEF